MLRSLMLAATLAFAGAAIADEATPAAPKAEAKPAAAKPAENPRVLIKTSMGDITVELFQKEAPVTVKNFLDYVDENFYDGTIFHRVISGFMIQGGGFDKNLRQKGTRNAIENEATNGMKNKRGTLAMARTMDPHSATSQFFINVVDNPSLDFSSPADGRTWGYAVFGRVVEGMDVVDAIKAVPTTMRNGMGDVPETPVEIVSARRVE
jgi:cyclophilin family peptidyl-prolyl cis-trans isomerase